MPIKLLHVGLGPIGGAIVRHAARRAGLLVVGAVDVDAALVGRDVGEVVGLRRQLGVKVGADLTAALRSLRPEVAIVSTTSSLFAALPIFETILKAKGSLTADYLNGTREIAVPRSRVLCALVALPMLISLVAMNYHFVSDVIAGSVLGGIVGAYAVRMARLDISRIHSAQTNHSLSTAEST